MKAKRWDECSPAAKLARWNNVLRVLRALTPAQRRDEWDMGIFGQRTPCGTTACAAGHCAMDPWFNRRGLRMKWRRMEKLYSWEPEQFDGDLSVGAQAFFGPDGAEEIFYNPERRPVRAVIAEVKNYIEILKLEIREAKREKAEAAAKRKRTATSRLRQRGAHPLMVQQLAIAELDRLHEKEEARAEA